ncbi:putative type VI secretion system effector [Chitinimonas sp. BJB300]|uniref:putative type VI secretion system effector n=1 Tax=Chitinimonas sp. BJB300 TaxID=1559339 RepID=UPI000C0CC94C|nr:putative type VI secretion system effector [Chitinimonas sp. BJB300]PHV09631.1 hypothetical protein CSQ89_20665 [Chitinimonas sp. BJB300]TSJ83856.1 hypothetical protein FG002_020665 [Chitinimonas sp. BJB300]
MTDANFLPQPNVDGLVKLTGSITGYSCRRESASFVFTESDQTKMGVIAIGAAMAGLGGQAISTAANATSMEEEADYVQFSLNGQPVKGWVWRSPFKNGDEVEVAAEWQGDHFEAFGIARPKDKTIALYPHSSRGMRKHTYNAAKWWLIGTAFVLMVGALMCWFVTEDLEEYLKFMRVIFSKTAVVMIIIFGVMTFFLARKWLPFVRLAEKVFRALDWPNPSNVDLVKSSNAQRTEKDPGEFGTFYFRY